MKKSIQSKREALSKEERAVVTALRRLRAAEAKGGRVRPELLEHGYVSGERAAELLEVSPEEIAKRTDPSRWKGEHGGIPTVGRALSAGGLIPISELHREILRRHRESLRQLANEVVDLVKSTSARVAGWHPHEGYFPFGDDGPMGPRGLSLAGVADRLGISAAAVNRLVDAEDGLFCWGRSRGGFVVTEQEISAYERKLAAQTSEQGRKGPHPAPRSAGRSRSAA